MRNYAINDRLGLKNALDGLCVSYYEVKRMLGHCDDPEPEDGQVIEEIKEAFEQLPDLREVFRPKEEALARVIQMAAAANEPVKGGRNRATR